MSMSDGNWMRDEARGIDLYAKAIDQYLQITKTKTKKKQKKT
jgi:hypothetical protein